MSTSLFKYEFKAPVKEKFPLGHLNEFSFPVSSTNPLREQMSYTFIDQHAGNDILDTRILGSHRNKFITARILLAPYIKTNKRTFTNNDISIIISKVCILLQFKR